MLKQTVAALLKLGVVILAVGCNESKPAAVATNSPATATSPSASSLASLHAEPLVVSGPLVVENQIDVAAQREGVVVKILAEPGARVRAGQTLALLDDRQITADLEAARARMRSVEADMKNWEAESKVLQSDFDRAQKMWDAQLITKEQLDHAKYKAESDQWDVKRVAEMLINAREMAHSQELELEKTRIRAPFDGIVARRYVRAGEKVALGGRLFWVTAEGPLRLHFTLPEKYLGHVKMGQELPLTSPDVPGEKHTARVIAISPVVDPASGTIEILAELAGARGGLRPGMTVNLSLDHPQ